MVYLTLMSMGYSGIAGIITGYYNDKGVVIEPESLKNVLVYYPAIAGALGGIIDGDLRYAEDSSYGFAEMNKKEWLKYSALGIPKGAAATIIAQAIGYTIGTMTSKIL